MYDLIIIGAGVAGFTSAIFAARRGLKTLVIGKDIAGQANYTDLIENFPSQDSIGGFELVSKIRAQAEKFGAEFLEAEVSKLKALDDSFVITAYDLQYKAQSIILAYGKNPQDLAVPGENELKGKGVSYCVNCDAPLYKNKIVAVAGIGDIAADAGLMLSKYAKKVYILSKTDKFTAHPALHKSLFRKSNVELVPHIQIQEILGEKLLTGLKLLHLDSGQQSELALDGLFVELGYVVDSHLVQNIVNLDQQQQIIVDENQQTSIPGMFAAGDATHSDYKQAVISAGEGAKAALACYDWLMRKQGGVGLTSDWTQIKRVK
jgi:thioredoxin reductase (NADPH)